MENMNLKRYSVLVIDDDELIRYGLVHVLKCSSCCSDAEVAGSMHEAAHKLAERLFEVVMVKFELVKGGAPSFQNLRSAHPDTKFLLLLGEDEEFWEALEFECEGYAIRHLPAYQLDVALRAIGEGYSWIGPVLSRYLLKRGGLSRLKAVSAIKPVVNDKLASLSNREREILYLLSEAFNGSEIAEKLSISKQTVKLHISNCIKKLGVQDRSQAVSVFLRSKSAYGDGILS